MNEILTSYTSYNVWANKKMIDMTAHLPEGYLDTPVPSSFPSIRKTIYHMWDAQAIWLNRMQGISLETWPSDEFENDFAGFDVYFIQQSEDFDNYVKSKSDGYFEMTCFYKNMQRKDFQSKNWEIIMHCMNHSTYHRGQIITILRNLGISDLESTDYITYFREVLAARS